MKPKCEILTCTQPATNFQNTEMKVHGSNQHAYCDTHIQTHGGIRVDNTMIDPPKEKVMPKANKDDKNSKATS